MSDRSPLATPKASRRQPIGSNKPARCCWQPRPVPTRHVLGAAAANRAHLLTGQCEGARSPTLAGLDAVTPLTEREREVALLAARGRASRAIAEQHLLSERTVENHLQRIYTKIGARGRSDLRALLGIDRD